MTAETTTQDEVATLKARVAVLTKLIEGELYRKEPFGPLMECRYCKTVKGNGHLIGCHIGQILMGTYKGG